MQVRQYFSTDLFLEGDQNVIRVTTVPRHSMAPRWAKSSAADVGEAIITAVRQSGSRLSSHPQQPSVLTLPSRTSAADALSALLTASDEWLSGLEVSLEQVTGAESTSTRDWQIAQQVASSNLIPAERSPLSKESLNSLVAAVGGGTTASVALATAVSAQGKPLLILSVAAGIVVIRIANAVGKVLEEAIEDVGSELLGLERSRRRRKSSKRR